MRNSRDATLDNTTTDVMADCTESTQISMTKVSGITAIGTGIIKPRSVCVSRHDKSLIFERCPDTLDISCDAAERSKLNSRIDTLSQNHHFPIILFRQG
jgi:hypothetical protein